MISSGVWFAFFYTFVFLCSPPFFVHFKMNHVSGEWCGSCSLHSVLVYFYAHFLIYDCIHFDSENKRSQKVESFGKLLDLFGWLIHNFDFEQWNLHKINAHLCFWLLRWLLSVYVIDLFSINIDCVHFLRKKCIRTYEKFILS